MSRYNKQEYKGKIYVKNIGTNLCRIRNQLEKVGSGSEKNHSGSTTLFYGRCVEVFWSLKTVTLVVNILAAISQPAITGRR
jgi:hypothetical protein